MERGDEPTHGVADRVALTGTGEPGFLRSQMRHWEQLDHTCFGEGVPTDEFGYEADAQAELDGSEHGPEVGDHQLQARRERATEHIEPEATGARELQAVRHP